MASINGGIKKFKANTNNWKRTPSTKINNKNFLMQLLDIDITLQNKKSIFRIYGVDNDGNSAVFYVHNFKNYFYVEIPSDWSKTEEEFAEGVITTLKNNLRTEFDVCTDIVEQKSILGYSFGQTLKFVQIFFSAFNLISSARNILYKNFVLGYKVTTYESTLSHELRFMVDKDIKGNCWLEIDASDKSINLRSAGDKNSNCSFEFDIFDENKIKAHNDFSEKWMKLAPFRILSFDIECAGRKGHFPEASKDKVIQIANRITIQGQDKPIVNNVFVLNTCSSIVGADVHSFRDERELLRSWAEFVRAADPDILTGYNIINFDIPYLVNRAITLDVDDFGFLGRINNSKIRIRNSYFSNQAYGKHETKTIYMEGRVIFDLLPIVQKEYKLRSYTLNAVSAHFLGQQKEDVHFSIITDLFEQSAESRKRLAVYCIKDAMLPQRLMDKLKLLINNIEMSRVTGVPISYLLTRGQQIKVISQLYRKARKCGILIPHVPVNASEGQFTGATVLDPVTGFYKEPIATLDFSSLYPSIMIAHNLCYTTLVSKKQALTKLNKDDYVVTPNGDYFVTPKLQQGLLPQILRDLLQQRKKAKRDLRNAKDPFAKGVLNGRQMALKISANSVYGFTGASSGSLPCIAISSSVTAYGREMILQTKRKVESEFTAANGYKHDAKVIYGDTDSVMVKFGAKSVPSAMELGKMAAETVTKLFKNPISLEFEKVYQPYLLMAKKRYAGMLWTDPDKPSHMDAKGIETVRRDNCALARDLVQKCLDKLLIEQDVEAALEFAKRVIKKLLVNKVDLSKLVISKSLGKAADSSGYKVKLPHVELAKRMAKRDSGSAPMVGDRVAYVIVQGQKGARQYEKAEDPIYVLEKGLPIDTAHYLEHQLKMPLERIFSPIIGNVNQLLFGEHTRNIKISNSSNSSLMKFFSKSKKCRGCRNVLAKDEKAICRYCQPNIDKILLKETKNLRSRERRFSELWVQCQRCQDTVAQEILCSNRDCPIFYRRTKAAKDLDDALESMGDF